VPMTEELPGPPRVLLPERLVDVGLAVGLALVVIIAETFGERTATDTMAEIVLGVGGALALLERRRRPMAVLAMNAAIVATEGLLALRVVSAPTLLVALYTVCARRPRDEGLKAAGIALVAMLVQVIHTTDSPVGNAVSAAVSVAAATGIGLYMGTRRQYVEALRERALQLARERALEADSALAEERARIARELHDVVAHHVTLMVVQAGALRETLPADDPGRPMLDSMADTGRQALAEMRRVLDLLRVTDGSERGPQPSVEQIESLVTQMRTAGEGGVTVTPLPAMPAQLGLSVPHVTRRNEAVFVDDSWSLRTRTLLSAGVRYDRLSHFDNQFSYRAGLTHQMEYVYAKLLYGTAFRSPSYREYLSVTAFNDTLQPA